MITTALIFLIAALFLCAGCVCLYLVATIVMRNFLSAQRAHYDFLEGERRVRDVTYVTEELESRLKEFDDYKKRVDALTVKAGFKL